MNRIRSNQKPESTAGGPFTAIHAKWLSMLLLTMAVLAICPSAAVAQKGQVLFGDVKIDTSTAADATAPKIQVVLYRDTGGEMGRQNIANGSRYRFSNLPTGDYQLAIEVDGNEVARERITIQGLSSSPYGFQHDLEFAWKPKAGAARAKPGTMSAADVYDRPTANKALFEKAEDAAEKKKYEQAVLLLKQIVDSDKADFQAWTLLGTVYQMQAKPDDAEQAYQSAITAKPTFALAQLDLGKLRSFQKKYNDAIDPLTQAVTAHPDSAEANYLLGEAYIQIRKGSKAIAYLEEAGRLGYLDAYLRLGWLYNAANLKDKAAAEYEEFLKKKPDYADRKKLEEYIGANKKP